MSQAQERTIRMMYHGKLEYITRPLEAKYEDFLEVAIERFAIPDEFKTSLQISNELTQAFEKDTFEKFLLQFPNNEIIFHIRVDYTALLDDLGSTNTQKPPLSKPKKRKRKPYVCVPVTRQNCFIGSFPGFDPSEPDPEEPQVKRLKANERPIKIKAKATECRRASSRKSIRY